MLTTTQNKCIQVLSYPPTPIGYKNQISPHPHRPQPSKNIIISSNADGCSGTGNRMEENMKKNVYIHTHTYISESLCHTAEINKTL